MDNVQYSRRLGVFCWHDELDLSGNLRTYIDPDGVLTEFVSGGTQTVWRPRPADKDLLFSPTGYERKDVRKHYRPYTRTTYKHYAGTDKTSRTRYTASSFVCPYLPVIEPDPDFRVPNVDLMNDLLSEARAEAVNYANSLGEFKQTSGMFQSTVDRAYRGLVQFAKSPRQAALTVAVGSLEDSWRKIRRRLRRKYPLTRGKRAIGKFTGSASDYWLLYHFGVETLIRDVNDSVLELQNSERARRPALTHVSVTQKNHGQEVYEVGLGDPGGRRTRRTESYSARIRLTLAAETDSPLAAWISDHGLVNPLSLTWELTTLSWAADYFIGIGKFLEAMDAPLYWSRSACWETRVSSVMYHDVYTGNGSTLTDSERPVYSATATQTARFASRQVRAPHAVPPQWNPKISTIRGVTLAALFNQLVRKRSRNTGA